MKELTLSEDNKNIFQELYLNNHEHPELFNKREEDLEDFISNPAYVVNKKSFQELLTKLYYYDFLNISQIDLVLLEDELDNGNYWVFQKFLENKLLDLEKSTGEWEYVEFGTIELISEITDILKIINRILISTTKKAEFNDNSEDFLWYMIDYQEKLLEFYSNNEILKQEESNDDKFLNTIFRMS